MNLRSFTIKGLENDLNCSRLETNDEKLQKESIESTLKDIECNLFAKNSSMSEMKAKIISLQADQDIIVGQSRVEKKNFESKIKKFEKDILSKDLLISDLQTKLRDLKNSMDLTNSINECVLAEKNISSIQTILNEKILFFSEKHQNFQNTPESGHENKQLRSELIKVKAQIPILQKSINEKTEIIKLLRTEAIEKLDAEKRKAIKEKNGLELEIHSMKTTITAQEEKIFELHTLNKMREGKLKIVVYCSMSLSFELLEISL